MGSHSVAQTGLKLEILLTSASLMLGLLAFDTMLGTKSLF